MKTIRTMLEGLTLGDLREWAGNKIYNRGKEYVERVSQLSRTEDGTLVAWVSGTDEYATSVGHAEQGEFNYDCTCPYDYLGPCKHVVAVLLAAARRLEQNEEIPLLDLDDDLYLEAFEEDDGDWMEEEEGEQVSGDPPVGPAKGCIPQIQAMLAGKTRDELQRLLVELALDFPEGSVKYFV